MVFDTIRPFVQSNAALDIAPMVHNDQEIVCIGTLDGLQRLWVNSGEVEDVLGGRDARVAVPAVAADPDGGCWFAAEDGTVGRAMLDGTVEAVQLLGGHWPVRIVPSGDRAWVLTEKGTWLIRL